MGKICRAAHPDPLALGGGDLVADALTDNFALELREREQGLLHPKCWNWPLRRQTMARAGENAQILAIQGEFALWVSWLERS